MANLGTDGHNKRHAHENDVAIPSPSYQDPQMGPHPATAGLGKDPAGCGWGPEGRGSFFPTPAAPDLFTCRNLCQTHLPTSGMGVCGAHHCGVSCDKRLETGVVTVKGPAEDTVGHRGVKCRAAGRRGAAGPRARCAPRWVLCVPAGAVPGPDVLRAQGGRRSQRI